MKKSIPALAPPAAWSADLAQLTAVAGGADAPPDDASRTNNADWDRSAVKIDESRGDYTGRMLESGYDVKTLAGYDSSQSDRWNYDRHWERQGA
jgi:hypothetical protein